MGRTEGRSAMLSRYSFFFFAFRFAGRYFGTPSRSRR